MFREEVLRMGPVIETLKYLHDPVLKDREWTEIQEYLYPFFNPDSNMEFEVSR